LDLLAALELEEAAEERNLHTALDIAAAFHSPNVLLERLPQPEIELSEEERQALAANEAQLRRFLKEHGHG
jgi:hypothetical protein